MHFPAARAAEGPHHCSLRKATTIISLRHLIRYEEASAPRWCKHFKDLNPDG
jgi:hypothetical protein